MKKTNPVSADNYCPDKCPGCLHHTMAPSEILAQKQRWLNNKLSEWSDRLDRIYSPHPSLQLGYRNKVCLSTAYAHLGWKFGLIDHHEIIDLGNCPIHSNLIQESINLFKIKLPENNIFPMVYFVQSGDQITVIVKHKEIPDMSWFNTKFTECLRRLEIKGVWLHLNPCAGRKVFAKNHWHLLWGSPRSIGPNGLIYGPKSFQQLIPSLFEQAMNQSEAFLSHTPGDLMIDLYCGTGAGLVRWTDRQCRVIGVELDGEAISCAQKNAPNATVLRGQCKDRIPQLVKWTNEFAGYSCQRLIYLNPPRTGIEPEVLEWASKKYLPARIVYLSCSAGTLSRDLKRFEEAGYYVVKITPYDFFPQTRHVECLALLNRDL